MSVGRDDLSIRRSQDQELRPSVQFGRARRLFRDVGRVQVKAKRAGDNMLRAAEMEPAFALGRGSPSTIAGERSSVPPPGIDRVWTPPL